MSPSPSLPEFFLDRSLGRYAVPDALRAAGWTIRTHHEVYAERDEAVEDVEWLEYAGSSGLVVLTRDKRLRYRRAEIAAIRRFGVRAFALTSGMMTATEQAMRLVASEQRIAEACLADPPFVYAVHSTRLVRIYP